MAYRPAAQAISVPRASTAYRVLYQGRPGARTSFRDIPSQWTSHASPRDAPEKRSVAAASQPVGRDRAPGRTVPVDGERRVGVRRVARNPDGPDVVRGERRDPVELVAREFRIRIRARDPAPAPAVPVQDERARPVPSGAEADGPGVVRGQGRHGPQLVHNGARARGGHDAPPTPAPA